MDAKSVEEFQEQIGIKFHEPSLTSVASQSTTNNNNNNPWGF